MRKIITKTITLVVFLILLLVGVLKASNITSMAVNNNQYPLIIKANQKRNYSEYFEYSLPQSYSITGTHLAVKVFLKNATNTIYPIKFTFYDTNNNEFKYSSYFKNEIDALIVDRNEEVSAVKIKADGYGNVYVPYMFHGYILIPYDEMSIINNKPSDIVKLRIEVPATGLNTSYLEDKLYIYLFDVADVTYDMQNETFASINNVVNFEEVNIDNIDVYNTSNDDVWMTVYKATNWDMRLLEKYINQLYEDCDHIGDVKIIESFDYDVDDESLNKDGSIENYYMHFYRMGQKSEINTYSLTQDNTALSFKLNPIAVDYDPSRNPYASVHFNFNKLDARDWQGAKGVTVWVKNPQNYAVSFGIEIFQYNSDTNILEQYNLSNSNYEYKTIYAYDTILDEEFSYQTQTYIRVPAKFEGWLRIPLSQYEAPAWSLAPEYNNKGILNVNKYEIHKISLTRLFSANQNTVIIIDNIGIYYNDFSVSTIFDKSTPSIKDCIEGNWR